MCRRKSIVQLPCFLKKNRSQNCLHFRKGKLVGHLQYLGLASKTDISGFFFSKSETPAVSTAAEDLSNWSGSARQLELYPSSICRQSVLCLALGNIVRSFEDSVVVASVRSTGLSALRRLSSVERSSRKVVRRPGIASCARRPEPHGGWKAGHTSGPSFLPQMHIGCTRRSVEHYYFLECRAVSSTQSCRCDFCLSSLLPAWLNRRWW